MADYFALLDEPRRPWLEGDSLKQKFLTRSAEVHPDRVHGADEATRTQAQARFTQLNAAYLCLREPRERLRHLLELELGSKPGDLQEMPPPLASLFMDLASAFRETDAFLKRFELLTSPLLRVQGFAQAQALSEKLSQLQRILAVREQELEAELRALDHRWGEREPAVADRRRLLTELERLAREFGFVSRWQAQIQERLVRLMP